MDNLFVIGDPHGEHTKLELLLKNWKADSEQLIILGDLVDRGESPYKVIKLAMELEEKYGAKILRGNHEEMFLAWMEMPSSEMDFYYNVGGRETIHSFFNKNVTFSYTPLYVRDMIVCEFDDEIEFLKNLPLYYEHNQYLFVHAGVNLAFKDWKNSRDQDFTWIREMFHYGKNETGKTIFFGHTPTIYLNEDESPNIWVSHCKTKIGIDGGAVFGGLLHGVSIDERGFMTSYSVAKDLSLFKQMRQID